MNLSVIGNGSSGAYGLPVPSSRSPPDDMDLYTDYTQIPAVWISFVSAFVIIWILALTGNAMVIYTVWSNRRMHTVVNYYIVNLAVCDFAVGAFVLPMKLLELAAPSALSFMTDELCTAMLYLQTIVVFASVLTLVATCLERYFAICDPLVSRMQLQSKRRAKKILFVVWMAPCIVASPFLYPLSKAATDTLASDLGSITRTTCIINIKEPFRQGYYTFLFFTIYLLPLTFIGWTCHKIAQCLLHGISLCRQGSLRRQDANRRKIAKMVIIVAIAFGVSWTPYFVVSMVTQIPGANFMQSHNYFTTMLAINLCAFLNSCINPFIYVTMSTRFRNGFRRIVRSMLCCCCSFQQNAEEDPFCGAENLKHIKSNSSRIVKPQLQNSTYSVLCCPVYGCRQVLTESLTSGCGYATNAAAAAAAAAPAIPNSLRNQNLAIRQIPSYVNRVNSARFVSPQPQIRAPIHVASMPTFNDVIAISRLQPSLTFPPHSRQNSI